MLKLSIITVAKNNKNYIEDCIKSVIEQKYPNCEYIIIDGGSTDGTVDIIKKYHDHIAIFISEPDGGIYDAMNKGIKLATGDIVGILNSDDIYNSNDVLTEVVGEFTEKGVDSVFADLVYVDRNNTDKIVRYYKSANFTSNKFAYGWMPPHPTFFLKRKYYEKYGLFKTDYKIAADYELLVRLLGKNKLSYSYLQKVIIKMRSGGISTSSFKSNWILNMEIIRACRENGIQTNIFKVFSKYLVKFYQLIERPSELEH
jgi:glycosyltransferase involved in cell wall biosynthesis